MTSDESQDAMRIFATSPLDRDVIMYRETGGHRPRTDSNSSASSQDRFKIGAFAGRSFNKEYLVMVCYFTITITTQIQGLYRRA